VNWVISGGHFTDVSCGFRAYSREAAMKLNLTSRFTYTHESLINLAAKGVHMAEIPLQVRGSRSYGRSRVAPTVWGYGFRALPIILRALRDTRPLMFFGLPAFGLVLVGLLMLGLGCFGALLGVELVLVLALLPLLLGVALGIVSLLSDQLARLRRLEEKTLYYNRLYYFNGIHQARMRRARLLKDGAEGNGTGETLPVCAWRDASVRRAAKTNHAVPNTM
jgi:hypothetical protein